MIAKVHAELQPIVDKLHEAGERGMYNLAHMPYRGAQWKFRAYQRDPFVMAFTDVLPEEFGTFERRNDLIAHKRLVFHSDPLKLDLVLRRRGSFGAFRPSKATLCADDSQLSLPMTLLADAAPKSDDVRLAALIWDTPALDAKHKPTGPLPLAVRLARKGHPLDDNEWESGFVIGLSASDELIPDRIEYKTDMPDWDIESDSDAQ